MGNQNLLNLKERVDSEAELYQILLDIETEMDRIWTQTRNSPAEDIARIMKEFSEKHAQNLFELEKKMSTGEATPSRTAFRMKYVMLNFRMIFEAIEKKAAPEEPIES